MFMYIFPYVGQLTDNYHSGGGLVVAADGGLDRVKELIEDRNNEDRAHYGRDADDPLINPTDEEFANLTIYKIEGEAPEAVFVFPDAGCC